MIKELFDINKIICNIFIFISIISANHRCGFSNQINDSQNINRTRPTTDTSTFSPTGYFLIHYDVSGQHAPNQSDENENGIPDYIDEVGIIADSTRYILVDVMGFNSEPIDDDGLYDIYIQDMGPYYYGLTVFDDQTGAPPGPSYMKIDNEYEEGEYFIPGINTMKLTVAHEFFHAIQRGYRPYPTNSSTFLFEMSSTWIEDVIVPYGDDYINWTGNFFNNPEINIDDTNGYSIALYGHYLAKHIEGVVDQTSSNIIKQIWERFSVNSNALSSIDYVLINEYNVEFIDTWVDFCAKNLFNGQFDDMNNDIYYYNDQILSDPISSNIQEVNSNIEIEDLLLGNNNIRIKSFNFTNDLFFHVNNIDPDIIGSISIVSDIESNNELLSLQGYSHMLEDDVVHFVLGADNNSFINLYIDLHEVNYGDINQDSSINVLDINMIINHLIEYTSFSEFQLILADMNNDAIINVIDIIEIILIIIE